MVSDSFSPSRSATTVLHSDQQQKQHQHLKPPPPSRPGCEQQRSHTESSGVQAHVKTTMPSRRLSLPDLKELRQEWARREALQINTLPPGKLQVTINDNNNQCFRILLLPINQSMDLFLFHISQFIHYISINYI